MTWCSLTLPEGSASGMTLCSLTLPEGYTSAVSFCSLNLLGGFNICFDFLWPYLTGGFQHLLILCSLTLLGGFPKWPSSRLPSFRNRKNRRLPSALRSCAEEAAVVVCTSWISEWWRLLIACGTVVAHWQPAVT